MSTQRTDEKQLALGRILRIASRPYQDGDIAEYERCRAIIMDGAEPKVDSIGYCRPGWNFGNSTLD